jgi:hypothetical protein
MCGRSSYNERTVGKCSICGGLVTVPIIFYSTVPPAPTCQQCGASMDINENLPIVPMKRNKWQKWVHRGNRVDEGSIYKKISDELIDPEVTLNTSLMCCI